MDAIRPGVLELVAEGRAAEEVEEVQRRQVLGVGDVPKRRRYLHGELLAQLGQGFQWRLVGLELEAFPDLGECCGCAWVPL